jgi:predicted acylesterase/phospholipase RssA
MMKIARTILIALISHLLLLACAGPERLAAVPEGRTTEAQIAGMPNIRYWVDEDAQPFVQEALQSRQRELEYRARIGQTGPLPPTYLLAISGGGDNGAFGAGLLCGWTAASSRPEFKGVTGVSTGALIAPMAFLGPAYDRTLREVYTETSKKDIFEERFITAALFDDAMADTSPMFRTVSRYVDADLLAKIAAEYRKGRLLFVATTDLDARHPVVWNMTAIAAVGTPEALQLFRKVLVASAAIPGAFPPVMIDVEVDGKRYQEMHVDGGAMAQVFLYPLSVNVAEFDRTNKVSRKRVLYLIRNARLEPDWGSVERKTLSIAGKAISSLIHTQGLGDLYRIYLTAKRDGLDYNLAYIPSSFMLAHKDSFDPAYMRPLFDTGYELARKGYPWEKAPPGYAVSTDEPPARQASARK